MRAALTAVLKELAHKARITVSSSDSYAELRGICDVTAAVDGFIAEKMAPLTTRAIRRSRRTSNFAAR